MSQQSSQLPTTEWQSETLRLTAFPVGGSPELTPDAWWSGVVGDTPEKQTIEPKKGMLLEEGSHQDGKLTLKVDPIRIDWLFGSLDARMSELELPSVGRFSETCDMFVELMGHWFSMETCPSLRRLAFGAVLLNPVESREEGYRRLDPHLPKVSLDPEGTSDFAYQINRPRESGDGTIMINRLSKWSVAALRFATIEVSTLPLHGPVVEHFACRLQLDINTPPDLEVELSCEILPSLFLELVNLGKEIAEKGDLP